MHYFLHILIYHLLHVMIVYFVVLDLNGIDDDIIHNCYRPKEQMYLHSLQIHVQHCSRVLNDVCFTLKTIAAPLDQSHLEHEP